MGLIGSKTYYSAGTLLYLHEIPVYFNTNILYVLLT